MFADPRPDVRCSVEASDAPLRCGLSDLAASLEETATGWIEPNGPGAEKTPTLPSPGVPGEGKEGGNAAGPPLAASQTGTARPPGILGDVPLPTLFIRTQGHSQRREPSPLLVDLRPTASRLPRCGGPVERRSTGLTLLRLYHRAACRQHT